MRTLLFSLPPARPAHHGQRRAQASLVLLLFYAYDKLGVKVSLVASIGSANVRSIALFASLGFEVDRTVFVFGQVEIRVTDLTVSPRAGQRGVYESIPDACTVYQLGGHDSV